LNEEENQVDKPEIWYHYCQAKTIFLFHRPD
jgi:hypothetical protein